MNRRQRGMLLLPVAIVLAITGALAYTMTREGAMSVAGVDRQYDLEAARYLAEAGLRLAKWQNEKRGCGSEVAFDGVTLPGVAGAVRATDVAADGADIDIDVVATGPLGSVSSASRRNLQRFDRSAVQQLILAASDGDDTYIQSGSATQGSSPVLQATDNASYPLIRYSLGKVPSRSRIARAELSLYQFTSSSVQVERSISVHAVTRDWKKDDATWIFPWTSPGGDYQPALEATASIVGNSGRYAWRIDSLVRQWWGGALVNHGVLLKPSGLNGANFYSFENTSSEKPRLMIDYYLRCS